MTNKKKSKDKKTKPPPLVRSQEERNLEVKKIIKKLSDLQLSNDYEPIRKLYDMMRIYINQGERVIINIPFPEIKKRIEGVLAVNVKEDVVLRLSNEV